MKSGEVSSDEDGGSEEDTFKDGKGAVRRVRFSTDRILDVIGLKGTGIRKSRSGRLYWIYHLSVSFLCFHSWCSSMFADLG
jgi:hypothetical protein